MKKNELMKKRELAEKIDLQFDEVAELLSEETLESMYMIAVIGGSGGTNTYCGGAQCVESCQSNCGGANCVSGCGSGSSGGNGSGGAQLATVCGSSADITIQGIIVGCKGGSGSGSN